MHFEAQGPQLLGQGALLDSPSAVAHAGLLRRDARLPLRFLPFLRLPPPLCPARLLAARFLWQPNPS